MDKSAIKTFAVESRRQLIESVKYQASLIGITSEGISEPISKAEGMETYDYGAGTHTIFDEDIRKRKSLVNEVNNKGFDNVVEEVAYTWFNRIIAIRYMEVNDYLPTRTRVLSSEVDGKTEPDIITEALDLDLDYTPENKDLIIRLKDENKLGELFTFLFIKQCNKLNEILPGLFKTTNDYLELLLNISFTNEDGVIRKLIDDIPEEDFTNQVEIIGWLYQYYISEKKDEVININNSNIKKEDIPAATQLFTTDWVVKYMVDNSLGRYWIERNPNSTLKNFLEYYLGEAEQDDKTQNMLNEIRSENISVNDLTFFDPCMGSGHILVYAFDVFFEIYKELGYMERDIPELILKNNIFGLDIDERAYQLAYFAVLMKARKYDRKILNKGIIPNVYAIQESANITDDIINFIRNDDETIVNDVIYLKEIFTSGKEFGSLIQVKNLNFDKLRESLSDIIENSKSKLSDINIIKSIEIDLMALINQAELLSKKYSAVVTNPPYMNKFETNLKNFAQKYYKDYSKDLFSMFIYRNFDFCIKNGYNALMTPYVWMFIKNYEELREYLILNKNISSLIQLEYSAFAEATVPICTFVLFNNSEDYAGIYLRLSEFKGGMEIQNEMVLKAINSNDVDYLFEKKIKTFFNIPGKPLAYWISNNFVETFSKGFRMDGISDFTGSQNKTANNKKYLRYFWEVDYNKINSKWIVYAKGGSYRKYYGNLEIVVDWSEEARSFYKNNKTSNLLDEKYWYKQGITYNDVSSKGTGFRYLPENCVFDMSGPSMVNVEHLLYCIGLLNSNVTFEYLKFLAPTIHIKVYNINSIPIIIDEEYKEVIEELSLENIKISKEDWDSNETSLDFKKSPLIKTDLIKTAFEENEFIIQQRINKMKENEEKINGIFIEIYKLQEDLQKEVEEKDITLTKPNYESDIKSFISYAVGCMFGRYSLDNEGLQFAGGEFNLNNYQKFKPDDDNIIPILDTEYFEDDIVGRFIDFVKVCFGEKNLEENLDFIAGALNKKGKTSREKIRNYFLKDFFNDHAKMYKKCPIYWQFDSGRQNAFKCLIYMHRYEPDLVARVRTDYLHKTQKAIEQNLVHCENIINNSSNKSEVRKATQDKSRYVKQLDEIKVYDEALRHMATQNIKIDLDDGVKVNHAKFQKVKISKEGEKAKKINLLKNI